VAFFLEPLLEHLDRSRVRVTGVDVTGGTGDDVTQRLRQRCEAWRDLSLMSDHAAAAALRDDGYDIIIELAGYTAGSKIGAMAYAPAPIIVSYLGYPCSTGMPGITHRIVDSLTDPPGAEAFATETLVRLDPCFLCYRKPFDAPPPRLERRSGEGVVFASFNAIMKIQPPTLDLWARVLAAVPESTLLLKFRGLDSPRAKERLTQALADRGVDQRRLEIVDHHENHAQHLRLYERVDIALDTFPYHGTTTTCDALAMGVPVITRVGETHAARVGLSLLSAVGLSDLAASDDEAYVDAAQRLARSPTRLAELRATLPERLAGSPLCDEKAYALRFMQALEGMARERGLIA
jgi:predicted O-linked N-acetylglucosamine transferase (SPINDLY family)